MAQEFKVGIIGGGPAGCFCAYHLQNDSMVTIFEMSSPLKTLLATGGGRCNLAHAEYDFRELTKFYPRGEKFLYSVFSKYGTAETLEFFRSIGVETYTQDDNRVFPTSNSAADVREKFLKALKADIKKEKALRVNKLENGLEVVTDAGSYKFDAVVIAVGGHAGYNIAKYLGHNIIEPKPALVGLKTDKLFPSGVVIKNVKTKIGKKVLQDDLLFTHNGISGPLAFKISSLNARENFPYTVTFDLTGEIVKSSSPSPACLALAGAGVATQHIPAASQPATALSNTPLKSFACVSGSCYATHSRHVPYRETFSDNLQKMFDTNPHKTLKNVIGELVPKSFAAAICPPEEIKCSQVSAKIRDEVAKNLRALELKVLAHSGAGEVVTCGGVDLKEINSKTMESKLVTNLYFCGEVLDIDGFCGGFNLQNCWSTAYIAAQAISDYTGATPADAFHNIS